MKIPFAGGSSQSRFPAFNDERTVNMYVVADKDGKNQLALMGTPGNKKFSESGVGPGRGMFKATASGRVFLVSEATLYEIFSDGSSIIRGVLNTATSPVRMRENPTQMMVMDGRYGYIFTYSTNSFAQITDPDFPYPAGHGDFCGGYFMIPQVGTGKFYISDLYNGLSWGALNFATAENSPDSLIDIVNVGGTPWLFGTTSTEVWNLTGASRFPFELISGSVMDTGIVNPLCAQAMDTTVLLIGENEEGSSIVYRATGFIPQRISTEAIEKVLAQANKSTLRTWKYQQEGHLFFVITGGGMETTLVYDITTQIWHERAYLNALGEYEPHRGNDCITAFDKTLVCDRENGKVYRMALDLYDDDGAPMPADRIFTHLSEENSRIRLGSLTVDCETGVGTQTGLEPMIELSLSNDNGHSWFGQQVKSLGKVGEYLTRVVFRQLGAARTRTFRVRIASNVRRAIVGLYLNT